MIVECLSCRRGHDLTGWSAGTSTRCGCGALVAVPGRGDAPLPCPTCATMVAPSLGQCPRCAELLFTTECARCADTHFHGHAFCGSCGAALLASAAEAPRPVRARGTEPPITPDGDDEVTVSAPLPVPVPTPMWRVDPPGASEGVAARRSRGPCPRCHQPLAQRAVGRLDLDACDRCGGMFLPALVLTQLLVEGDVGDAAALRTAAGSGPTTPPPVRIAWCPCCAAPMRERPIATGATARVSVCKAHGVWIDRAHLPGAVRVLTVRSLGRAGDVERSAFRDQLERKRFHQLLGHARELAARGSAAKRRSPLGLLAELFG